MICPNCQSQVPGNSMFCQFCGYKLNAYKNTASIKWKPILAIAALCLVAVLLITMFTGSGNDLSGTYTSESGIYTVVFKQDGTCTWLQGGYTFNGTYQPTDDGWQLNILGGGIARDTIFSAKERGGDLIITGGIVYGEVFTKNSSSDYSGSVNNGSYSSSNISSGANPSSAVRKSWDVEGTWYGSSLYSGQGWQAFTLNIDVLNSETVNCTWSYDNNGTSHSGDSSDCWVIESQDNVIWIGVRYGEAQAEFIKVFFYDDGFCFAMGPALGELILELQ